jgi:hypothetical protein
MTRARASAAALKQFSGTAEGAVVHEESWGASWGGDPSLDFNSMKSIR